MSFESLYLWLGGNVEFGVHGEKGLRTKAPTIERVDLFRSRVVFFRYFRQGQFTSGFNQHRGCRGWLRGGFCCRILLRLGTTRLTRLGFVNRQLFILVSFLTARVLRHSCRFAHRYGREVFSLDSLL